MQNYCEFVSLISFLACLIAKDKTEEEIGILSAFFVQLGDTLATIAILGVNNKNE